MPLPQQLRVARWRVKIRDKETREPPHVTILRGTAAWRINLRTGRFMDKRPKPADVPDEVIEHIMSEENWDLLRQQWDLMYPRNPVQGEEDQAGE